MKIRGPIQFYVPGNGEDYIDPSRMQLYVKGKIKTAGGDNIGATAAVGPQNLFLQSLFSQVNVSLNDKLITPSSSTYPYREIIDSKKNSKFWSSCEKITVNYEFVLQRYTWQNERSWSQYLDADANIGLKARNKFTRTSKSCDLSGPLHADICFQERLISVYLEWTAKWNWSGPARCVWWCVRVRQTACSSRQVP